MSEILIDDAKRFHDEDFLFLTLDEIRKERETKVLIGFLGSHDDVQALTVSAPDQRLHDAALAWAGGHVSFTGKRPDLTRPLGNGTAVIVGIEADGTARCVTWSRNKEDCARLKGWAEDAVFPFFSRVPFETHFGWGNGGVPKPLTAEERAGLKLAPYYRRAWLDEEAA
jgi:hypothetical protein